MLISVSAITRFIMLSFPHCGRLMRGCLFRTLLVHVFRGGGGVVRFSSPRRLYFLVFLFFLSFWSCPCTVAKVTWRKLGSCTWAFSGYQLKAKDHGDTPNARWRHVTIGWRLMFFLMWVLPGLHMWMNICVCACAQFPGVLQLEK